MRQSPVFISLILNETKLMPVSVPHPVLHGYGFILSHSIRQGRQIQKLDQRILVLLLCPLPASDMHLLCADPGSMKRPAAIAVANFFIPSVPEINSYNTLIKLRDRRNDFAADSRFLQRSFQFLLYLLLLIQNAVNVPESKKNRKM